MKAESASLYRAVIENAVTGRSASTTVFDCAACTSVSQGDAASWRRNVVKASISTVRPSIANSTAGAPVESTGAAADACGPPDTLGVPLLPLVACRLTTHVHAGVALATCSRVCRQMHRSDSMRRITLI